MAKENKQKKTDNTDGTPKQKPSNLVQGRDENSLDALLDELSKSTPPKKK